MLRAGCSDSRLRTMSSPLRTPRYHLAATEAWWAARAYKGSAWVLISAGAVGFAVSLPLAALWTAGTPRLRLPALPVVEFGIPLSRLAWDPGTIQSAALQSLGNLVAGLGGAVWGVVVLTLLAVATLRSAARRPEIAVRRAVGATRANLRWAAGLEGAFMSVAAAALGGAAGVAVWRWLIASWPGTVGPARPWVPALLGLAGVGCIFLGAVLPVMWVPRTWRRTRGGVLSHGFLVPVVQLGVGLTIFLFAGVLQRQASRLAASSGSMARGTVFELRDGEPLRQRAVVYASLLRALDREPALGLVSLSSTGVLFGTSPVDFITTDCGRCSQGTLRMRFRVVPATLDAISADTFRAMGARVVAGRGLAESDSWDATPVAIVNATLAATHFESGRAVGRKVLLGSGEGQRWFTVVGVVEDLPPRGLGAVYQPPFAVYVSALQQPPSAVDLLVRPGTPGDHDGMDRVAARAQALLGHESALTGQATEASREIRAGAPVRWFGRLAQREGQVVLLSAMLGVFVVMELWVSALLPELAVRRAVGARRTHVIGYVLARAVGVSAAGMAVGAWLTLMAWGLVASALGALGNPDPGLWLRAGLLLSGAALLGAGLPTWRAARAAPAPGLGQLAG
jgi:putative ABC transport system permease protein